MVSIAQSAISDELSTASRRSRARPSIALIMIDALAVIGVLLTNVALFLRGWLHANIAFTSQGQVAGRIQQSLGIDVDREIAQIADRKVNATIAPTLWQYHGHYFQVVFILFVLVAVLLLIALFFARLRTGAQLGAFLAAIGAIIVIVRALSDLRAQSDSLPARVGEEILRSSIANRIFGLTTGTPTLKIGIGWPLYAAAAGVALVLLGTLLGLIVGITRLAHEQTPA